ncbi:GNAT family N-acetyltransferase [Mucilaginibacter sabulilitoris]|uniref:GNAT family N-acetyltransferase n=1 Tax=Mucilaginibacter sabulilitoris TaxID=1173583 RepID=A0ABZ0TE44_9SPHI|nr:GNAT family N-acetyltransferase [Mucilaginibacter sabulilitoris]WPU91242.1 GNAT family N-acetyltransferase [Mucilaginibacter sabulilitoris]
MIKATMNDKALVVNLLSRAFDANQSVNYIIRQDAKRARNIRILMQYSFEVCSRFGDIWLSDDCKACALVLYPHLKRTTLTSLWLDLQLIFKAIDIRNIEKMLEREFMIKSRRPKEPMAYLWFIGVEPDEQRKGIGSWLLQQIFVEAGKKNLPVYLETSVQVNLPWYERFGFEVYNRLFLGYMLYFFKREPAK